MNAKNLFYAVIIVGLIAGCASPQPATQAPTEEAVVIPPTDTAVPASPTPVPPSPTPTPRVTNIVIDGDGSDWDQYESVKYDLRGDAPQGSPDILEVNAFNNDHYFYIMIREDTAGVMDHYDVPADINGGEFDYQISAWPERNEISVSDFPTMENSKKVVGSVARGEVVEIKVPLSALGSQPVLIIHLQITLSSNNGDFFKMRDIPVVNETEPILTCAGPGQPGDPATTSITIDGEGDDWSEYEAILIDPANDVTPGAPDVICISTFSNDAFFYFSVWLNNPEINFGKYDWILTNETGRYSMGIWPLERKGDTGRFPDGEWVVNASIEVAQKQIIEGRIPLSLLGGKPVTEVNFKVFRSSAGPNDAFEFQSPTLAEVDG